MRTIRIAILTALFVTIAPSRAGADGILALESETSADPSPTPASLDELGLVDDFDTFGVFDELALLAAEDFVVSATRHAQRIEESPAAITVITREQILASGYQDLVDLLRLVPGADVYSVTEAHVAVGLRSRTTHGGDRTLALVDGRDLAPSLFGTPAWKGMPIDIGSIERIEIIRGGSSTLYGANALQGVVNIVTRRPTEDPFSAEGEAYGADQRRHGANLRVHGTKDAWSWWAGAGYDYRTSPFDPESGPPDYQAYRARLQGSYRPSEETELVAELGFSRLDGLVHLIEIGRGRLLVDWPYLRTRLRLGRTEVQIVAEHMVFLSEFDFALNMPGLDGSELITLASVPPLYQPHSSVQVVAQHDLDLFAGNRLTAGISFQAISFPPTSNVTCPDVVFQEFDPEACEFVGDIEGRAGVFIQDEWRLTDALTFTGGLRLDQNTLTPQFAFSPRAAFVWRPAPDHALRLSYGRAYRKPTFLQARASFLVEVNEDAPSDITSRLVHLFSRAPGNPDVRNEKADSYEFGWRGRFLNGMLVATADLFYTRFIDAIWFELHRTALEPGFGGVLALSDEASLRYTNRGEDFPLWSWGGEATLSFQPTRRLELRAIYGLDYFFETLPGPDAGDSFVQRVPFEPVHRLTGVVRWRPIERLQTNLDLIFVGPYEVEMPDPDSALLPRTHLPVGNHLLVNASVSYRLALGDADLELGVSALNAPDLDIFDMPSTETDRGPFGADRLSRRMNFFVRGQY